MDKDARNIIISPLLTEKALKLKADTNSYTFWVHLDANKIEIGKAIEELFKVRPLKVRTFNLMGKPKRLGRWTGRKAKKKKAIVKLKEGDTIAVFEGM